MGQPCCLLPRGVSPGSLAGWSHTGAGGDGQSSGSHGGNTQEPGASPVSEGSFCRRGSTVEFPEWLCLCQTQE